jgi:hypothetical protein
MIWLIVVGVVAVIVVALFAGLILWARRGNRKMDGEYHTVITEAEQQMLQLIRPTCPNAEVFHIDAVDINPRHLAIWIKTQTDEERDKLKRDRNLEAAFRATLVANGYPSDATPLVGFAFESTETVNRDFGGSWHVAMQ